MRVVEKGEMDGSGRFGRVHDARRMSMKHCWQIPSVMCDALTPVQQGFFFFIRLGNPFSPSFSIESTNPGLKVLYFSSGLTSGTKGGPLVPV